MPELNWRDAILKVLEDHKAPMHYTDIADAIAEKKLRTEFGATPAGSVSVTISRSIQEDGVSSPFTRIDRGVYALRANAHPVSAGPTPSTPEEVDETGLINAFGMYWSRAHVLWSAEPRILGQQQPESTPVDFCKQRGVYLLHDGRSVVYVGRATDQHLGVRLRQHISDRLNGRWDRFSWFGTCSVNESGTLEPPATAGFNQEMLIVTMEALLIEGLEPPQNRKRGDDFRAIEFLQVEDPDIRKKHIFNLIDELKAKF